MCRSSVEEHGPFFLYKLCIPTHQYEYMYIIYETTDSGIVASSKQDGKIQVNLLLLLLRKQHWIKQINLTKEMNFIIAMLSDLAASAVGRIPGPHLRGMVIYHFISGGFCFCYIIPWVQLLRCSLFTILLQKVIELLLSVRTSEGRGALECSVTVLNWIDGLNIGWKKHQRLHLIIESIGLWVYERCRSIFEIHSWKYFLQ